MIKGQEKEIGQGNRTAMVKLMGPCHTYTQPVKFSEFFLLFLSSLLNMLLHLFYLYEYFIEILRYIALLI